MTKLKDLDLIKLTQKNWVRIIMSMFVLATVIMFGLIVHWIYKGYHSYNDNKGPGNVYKLDHGSKPFWPKEGMWSWSTLPQSFLALFITSIIFWFGSLILLGGYLRGSRWINKANPFVKGQTYIRTKNQSFVFNSVVFCAALLLFTGWFADAWQDTISDSYWSGKESIKKDPSQFFRNVLGYMLSPSNWYYQCTMGAFIIPVLLFFKKHNWMPVVLPLAFLGALRTFADPKDVFENANWKDVLFHVNNITHLLIVMLPIFVMVANRITYTLATLKRTLLYTFLMVFVAYMIQSSALMRNRITEADNMKDTIHNAFHQGWGEMNGTITGLFHKEEEWYLAHHNYAFWAMLVPFGFGVVIGFYFIFNVVTFIVDADAKFSRKFVQGLKDWWTSIKTQELTELKSSMRLSMRFRNYFTKSEKVKLPKKAKYVPFGSNPANGNK